MHSDARTRAGSRRKRGSKSRMECGAARRRIKDDAQERSTNNKTKWRRLIAEILVRAGSPATGSASNGVECERRGFGRVRKVREAQPLGKICYLEPKRVPECNRDYRTPPLQRPANSPPGSGLRHLILLLPFLSPLSFLIFFSFCFFLPRGEGGTHHVPT